MFRGRTALPTRRAAGGGSAVPDRALGADAIQFYDHNFFDREVDMVPLLEVLAVRAAVVVLRARGRAVGSFERSWELVRQSRLRMAYIGAESPSDWLLHDVRKGTRTDQTLAAVEACRRNGVIPELSFMLAPPQDPEGRDRANFRIHPPRQATLPAHRNHALRLHAVAAARRHQARRAERRLRRSARQRTVRRCVFPEHRRRLGRAAVARVLVPLRCARGYPSGCAERIHDFTTVLGCRFPDGHRHPLAAPGARPRCARWLRGAIALPNYRRSVGAGPLEAASSASTTRAPRAFESARAAAVPAAERATRRLARVVQLWPSGR